MKISELIENLKQVMEEDGDLEVWIDSFNEIEFGEVESVIGKMYSGRPSNNNPHAYIVSSVEIWENNG